MIIGTDINYEPGCVVVGNYTVGSETYQRVSFFLRRRATVQEWKEYRASIGHPESLPKYSCWFYEASTD